MWSLGSRVGVQESGACSLDSDSGLGLYGMEPGFLDDFVCHGQTNPPSVPVAQLFKTGSFPEGQIMEHPGDFNTYRITSEEKRALDRAGAELQASALPTMCRCCSLLLLLPCRPPLPPLPLLLLLSLQLA